MEIKIRTGGGRARGLGLAGVGLAIALAGLDFVVLRGERVGGGSASLSGGQPIVFEIARTGEEHLIEIRTTRRRQGETRGRSIDYRLEGPDGQVLVEESELVNRKTRYLTLEPVRPGTHRLFVEDPGSGSGSAMVSVYVGDRRILRRFSF